MYPTKFLLSVAVALATVSAAPAPGVVENLPVSDFNQMVLLSTEALVNPPVDMSKATKDSVAGDISKLTSNVNTFISAASKSGDADAVSRAVAPYASYVEKQVHQATQVDPSVDLTQLNAAISQLNALAHSPSSLVARAADASKAGQQSWGGLVETDADGQPLFAPLARATTNLLDNNGAASSVYKGIDQLDHIVDGTAGFIGNVLAIPTLGLSKGVTNFLTGPIVQSLTHGTFATLSHLVGDPIDGVMNAVAPAASAFSNSVGNVVTQMNKLNVDTSSAQQANNLLRQRLQQIDSSMTFN